MDYFDKVADGVRSTAETIGKKTQDVVDISKLKLNAYEINSEIKKRFEALGRIVYDAKQGDYNCDIVIEENIRGIRNSAYCGKRSVQYLRSIYPLA